MTSVPNGARPFYGDKDSRNAGKKLPDGSLGSCNRSDFGKTPGSI
ncbi:hypothetical protein C7476_11944 [Phyllobacterium bourgognense]|uniref:Uncharacterized protein n=1 Tax=Phyllobacterium bourgognense TaxID=314236 RepID=A0A368YFV7_9HYPH|nr:hypothetical protein C7476_11944 [Phyllobacterium bourgognense]